MNAPTNADLIVVDELNDVSLGSLGVRLPEIEERSGWQEDAPHLLSMATESWVVNDPARDLFNRDALVEAAQSLALLYKEALDAMADVASAYPIMPLRDDSMLRTMVSAYRHIWKSLASQVYVEYVNDAAPVGGLLAESSTPVPDAVPSPPDADPAEDATAIYAEWLRDTAAARRAPSRWLALVESFPPALRTDMFEAMGEVAANEEEPTALVLSIVRGLNDDDDAIRLGATLAMDALDSPEARPFLEHSMSRETIPHIRGLQERLVERLRFLQNVEGTQED